MMYDRYVGSPDNAIGSAVYTDFSNVTIMCSK